MTPTLIERQIAKTYLLSTNRQLLNMDFVHDALSKHAYWSLGRSRQAVQDSFAHSALVCGVYDTRRETVGFARMVTDLTTFGWLCDVYVDPNHRGHGLGVAMVETLVQHPSVVSIKRQIVATADAHELYQRFGYEPLNQHNPSMWLVRHGKDA